MRASVGGSVKSGNGQSYWYLLSLRVLLKPQQDLGDL